MATVLSLNTSFLTMDKARSSPRCAVLCCVSIMRRDCIFQVLQVIDTCVILYCCQKSEQVLCLKQFSDECVYGYLVRKLYPERLGMYYILNVLCCPLKKILSFQIKNGLIFKYSPGSKWR